MRRLVYLFLLCGVLPAPYAAAQAPSWTVNASAFTKSMTVVGALATPVGAGDKVAAFVGSEGRGVAEAQQVTTPSGAQWRFFLTVHSRTPGETVAFRYYDAQANAVATLVQTVPFAANGLVGSVREPFVWSAQLSQRTTPSCTPRGTDWSISTSAFTRSMTVVGALATPVGAGDRVAAFVGSEVRGVAEAQQVTTPSGAQWRFFLTVYSRTPGETVAFRYYDASAGDVLPLRETLPFEANGLRGSVSDPFRWQVLTCPTPAGVLVDAKGLLAGFWAGGAMRTDLASRLPERDPFGFGQSRAPGFFDTAPGQTVADWVALELRSGEPASPPMTLVGGVAALMLADGRIVAPDGTGAVAFEAAPGSYFLALRHRNHLAVMSAAPLDCTTGACAFDFTTGADQAYGANAQIDLSATGSGPWALVPGDAGGEGDVDTDDFLVWFNAFGQASAYTTADLDGDGDVDTDDFLVWNRAFGAISRVPAAN